MNIIKCRLCGETKRVFKIKKKYYCMKCITFYAFMGRKLP